MAVALLCALPSAVAAQEAPPDAGTPADPNAITVLDAGDDPGTPATAVQAETGAQEEVEPFDGQATESTVRRSRITLLSIAAAMTVALAFYWWHTVPSRRLRVATRRAERRRAEPVR